MDIVIGFAVPVLLILVLLYLLSRDRRKAALKEVQRPSRTGELWMEGSVVGIIDVEYQPAVKAYEHCRECGTMRPVEESIVNRLIGERVVFLACGHHRTEAWRGRGQRG